MKALIQRVSRASVKVEGEEVSRIGRGILTLLGVEVGDTEEKLERLLDRILTFRIFEDDEEKMNLSLKDIHGEHLIISQFTLVGDCRKGRRPSFGNAEKPERAKELYDLALEKSRAMGIRTLGGKFQAHMEVEILNDGPVTFLIEA